MACAPRPLLLLAAHPSASQGRSVFDAHVTPVAEALRPTMLLLALLSSLPMFPGPRWLKECFARVVRGTKPVPNWHFTDLMGTGCVLGTVPCSDENVAELKGLGVGAVVSLNQHWEPQAPGGLAAACERAGVAHLGLPTPDYSSPSQHDIRRAVDFMSEHIGKGKSVYVHCNAGRGRSAVCVLAYLMESRDLSALQAYELVAAQRRITKLPTRLWGMPRPQWLALLRFERAMHAACKRVDPTPLLDD